MGRLLRVAAAAVVGLLAAMILLEIAEEDDTWRPFQVVQLGETSCANPSRPLLKRLCDDVPTAFDPALSDWKRTSLLRDWAYEQIPVAGAKSRLDPGSFWDTAPGDAFAHFSGSGTGAWCGITATLLRNLYASFDYDAWTLNVGPVPEWERDAPSALTHVVTLVAIDTPNGNRTVIQDAYLGGSFGRLDFRDVLKRLAASDAPEWYSTPGLTTPVLYGRDEHRGWTFDDECEPSGRGYRCEARLSADRLAERHHLAPETLRRIAAAGFPADLRFIFLWPFEIAGQGGDALLEDALEAVGVPRKR